MLLLVSQYYVCCNGRQYLPRLMVIMAAMYSELFHPWGGFENEIIGLRRLFVLFYACEYELCDRFRLNKLLSLHRQVSTTHARNTASTNRPVSQIPQCIRPIAYNAPFCNRNVHACAHFCYKAMHFGNGLMHCGICEKGLLASANQILHRALLMLVFGPSLKKTLVHRSRTSCLHIIGKPNTDGMVVAFFV